MKFKPGDKVVIARSFDYYAGRLGLDVTKTYTLERFSGISFKTDLSWWTVLETGYHLSESALELDAIYHSPLMKVLRDEK